MKTSNSALQSTNIHQQGLNPADELILVVKRAHLFKNMVPWQGLQSVDMDHFIHIINHKKEFHPRSIMERDETYKQIIPYLVFLHNDKIFLMERQGTASEQRLRSKLTVGIGGHIRKEDMIDSSIIAWARREFYEEVLYQGIFETEFIGVINDDSNDVGRMHIGLVLFLKGDVGVIEVKSELKSGVLVTLEELVMARDRMETWSQYIVDELQRRYTL